MADENTPKTPDTPPETPADTPAANAADDGKEKADGPKAADDGAKPANGDPAPDKDPAKPAAPAAEPASTPPLSTALNPQIVQAVGTTNHAVLNGAIPGANGVAYQKVAQAAAYAVQDSTDYMRSIMSMASATTGVAMQKMLATKEVDPYSDIIAAAAKAVSDAQDTFTKVGKSASGVVKDFDSMA